MYDDDLEELEEQEELEEEIALAELEEQLIQEELQQQEQEEKILKNKLKAIFVKVSQSGKATLSSSDKRIVKKAKGFKNLKKDIKRIELVLAANKAKNTSKLISTLGPILPYIGIGALIIILIIAIIAIIGSIMPHLFPDDENAESGASALYGINGTDFYGARMVYSDNDKATQTIVEDYVEFVENGIIEAKQITTVTANNGGETFDVELTIDIKLPSEDFDYSTFDETDFKTDYAELYEIVYDIAKSVYKTDNGTEFNGVSLIQCVDEIKYFGYGDLNAIKTISKDAIINKVSFVSVNDTENKLTQEDINSAVATKLDEHYSTYSTARAEKLFVKDYILEGEQMMSDVPKQNYVAMIFMPRKDVTFTKLSFAVGNANLSNFEIDINGEKLSHDGNNLGTEEKQSYIYGGGVYFSAEKFVDIDESNLTALSSEISLFEVAKLNNALTYLNEVNDGTNNYLTIKKNGVVVNLFNTEAYSFVEFESAWQAAQ